MEFDDGQLKQKYDLRKDTNLIHINSNLLAAIDIITTGIDPSYDSIIQICILPLNSFLKPSKGVLPFYTDIAPKRKHNIAIEEKQPYGIGRQRIINCELKGINHSVAADRLDNWFNRINFYQNKRIMPLCHNWMLKRSFLIDWLGLLNFNAIFDSSYRDPIPCSLYSNDRADLQAGQVPYPKANLAHLCSILGIAHDTRKCDAMLNCLAVAECWKRMISRLF